MKQTFDEDKIKELRKAGKAARKALAPEERKEKSEAIAERLLASEEFKKAEYIMIYKALGGEVSLEALENSAEAAGKHLLYPLCISETEMIALEPSGEDSWMCGSYGITEPVREKSTEIRPEDIDLMICPCTSFDESCNRIGMGGGYYDRYLRKCSKASIVAAAFEAQKADNIPAAPWDLPMQKVFTEKSVYNR